ncbi:elongation of very long chain fatty acids protein 2-like isoform X2 [Paramacrobiotus metropolitanus]|nr:elongation of very long chain fatty acids protein 2-like isoform X2 [Paramacrobiotus metropolitanus]
MGKMDLVLGITAGYLLFVWLGPRIMRQRPACELRRLMLVYNVVMVVWSGWMFAELLINSQLAGYNYFCTPYSVSFAPTELRIVRALWAYYVSKAVEFLDTVFMVLKKKEKQLTFLHVYHHAVMFPLWYFVMMDGPCCQAVFSAMLNSFVHVVMYSYYALALFPALHPYLWWKRYLTQLQLVQFLCVITATLTGLLTGCDYPFWLHVVNIAFLVSLVILFSRFYISAYIRRYRTPPASRPASAKIPLNKPEPPVLHLRPKAE